jgi:Methyltransferase domain
MERTASASHRPPRDTAGVPGCCDPDDYRCVFSDRFARRQRNRYQRRRLSPAAQRIVDFATANGLDGATVLEIGGGVGELQVELLRRGASHVTNLELSGNYENEATRLLESAGLTAQVTRRLIDVAQAPDAVEPADVVVLHRVVCCYPDYARLLNVAAGHTRRALAYSHPAANIVNRVQFSTENRTADSPAVTSGRSSPPDAMIDAAQGDSLTVAYRSHAWDWDVVGLTR